MRSGNRDRWLSLATLAVVGLVTVGCASRHCDKYDDELEVFMDLKAAGKLSGPAERFARLQAIASRHSLSRADQVLIVEEIAHSGLSDREKLDIMTTLIKNPVLTLDGKSSMLCFIEKGKLPEGPGQELLKTFVDYPTTRDVDDIFSDTSFVSAVRTDRVISGGPLMAPPSVRTPPPSVRTTPPVVAPAPPVVQTEPVPTIVLPGPDAAPAPAPRPVVRPSVPVITPIPVE